MGVTPNIDWLSNRTYTESAFVMRAATAIAAGDELLDTYGETKSSSQLYDFFGFFFPFARPIDESKLRLSAGDEELHQAPILMMGDILPEDIPAVMEAAGIALDRARERSHESQVADKEQA